AAISGWEEPRPPARARRGWDDAAPRRSRTPPRDREAARASRWGDDGASRARRDEGAGGDGREEGEAEREPDPERVEAAKKVAEEIKDSLAKRSDFDPKDLSKQIGTKHMGVAIHWSNARGFGILRTQAHGEVFVHAKSLTNCTELAIGDVVTFELGYDRKRQKAEALNCQKAGVGGYKEPEHFPRSASSGMDGDALAGAAEAAAKKLMGGTAPQRARERPSVRPRPGGARAAAMKLEAVLLLLGLAAAAGAGAAAASKKRPKVHLDVGFTDFQNNLTSQVAAQVKQAAASARWSPAQGDVLAANVTKALGDGLSAALKPLKLSIGKTWMALPQDAQKDAYVSQLKSAFLPVFASSARTAESHLRLSLERLAGGAGARDVAACGRALVDGLLAEHCYDASVGGAPAAASAHAAPQGNATKRRFCIQSVVDGLAHRLNDTQGLLSMSMRFEAGAMSLAQKAKAKAAAQKY
ncbi:unnamed protein product, partial [Prorocentrum cordatum]